MNCKNPNIPPYLHTNNRPKLDSKSFRWYQKVFRLEPKSGNTLFIEPAWINALSCNWSKIIKTKDVPIVNTDIGTNYYFCFALSLIRYKLIGINSVNNTDEKHVLTCRFHHSPKDCDYSHIEVLINHKIYKEEGSQPSFDQTYSYEDWRDKKALLKKSQGKFFKKLKKQYRIDMIKIFCLTQSQTGIREPYYFVKESIFGKHSVELV